LNKKSLRRLLWDERRPKQVPRIKRNKKVKDISVRYKFLYLK